MKKIIIGLTIGVLIATAILVPMAVKGKADAVITTQAPADILNHEQKVWMYTLEYCESNGNKDMKILDSNNRYSYGVLQFQMETFLREGKKYRLVDSNITMVEAEKLIFDVELQEKIAHQMLISGGESNWLNCWNHKLKVKYPHDSD